MPRQAPAAAVRTVRRPAAGRGGGSGLAPADRTLGQLHDHALAFRFGRQVAGARGHRAGCPARSGWMRRRAASSASLPAWASTFHGSRAVTANRLVTRCICTTDRSEEHTSELQSLMRISYAVFCLKQKIKRREVDQKTQTNTLQINV